MIESGPQSVVEQKGPQAVCNQRHLGLSERTKEVCNKCNVFDLSFRQPNECSKQPI